MTSTIPSPEITAVAWGRVEVSGFGKFRDVKLWPGGARPWDWSETNTHHVPGIQIEDIEELIERGARVLVLTRGMDLVLRTAPATKKRLEELGLEHHILETRQAVALYNKLVAEGQAVGAVMHSTC